MFAVVFCGIAIQILAHMSVRTAPKNMVALGIAQATNVQLKLNYSQTLGERKKGHMFN